MKLADKVFQNFKYNIHELGPTESAILKWPDIAAYSTVFLAKDINPAMDPEIVMRYIILMYTPGSPSYLQHAHIGKRKTLVMRWLEIEPEPDGTFGVYDDMLMVRGPGIRNRFVTFLMIQHSMDWTLMEHARADMEELLRRDTVSDEMLLDISEQEKKRKLIEETRKQIETARDRILKYERTAAFENAIEVFVAQKTSTIRPEARWPKMEAMKSPEFAVEGKPITGETPLPEFREDED